MHLTPQERDKLLIFVAGEVARARKARGLEAEPAGGHGLDLLRQCRRWLATARAWPRS